jgi:hypothetical protein
MATPEMVWLQLFDALPALPNGSWQTGRQGTKPLHHLGDFVTGFVNPGGRSPASEYVIEARFIERGGRPSPEHLVVGAGADEVAALQDLLARVKARYPQEGREAAITITAVAEPDRYPEFSPDARGPAPPRTILDDSGATQAVLFGGWIPGAIAAVVGGLVVGLASGSFPVFAIIVVAGTIVGYVVCLCCLFGIGSRLSKLELTPAAANRAFNLIMLSGVPAALAVAIVVAWLA